MITIVIQAIGAFAFAIGAFVLGVLLRKEPTKEKAESLSRIMHFLFHSGLTFPAALGLVYPGLTNFDSIIGLESLPYPKVMLILGAMTLIAGLIFIFLSIRSLGATGKGSPAFKLTKLVVVKDIYKKMRNPMSLGHYMFYVGISLMAGSTYLLLGSVLVVIPAHLFHLKYFEELELDLRYETSYRDYKNRTPFMFPKFNFQA